MKKLLFLLSMGTFMLCSSSFLSPPGEKKSDDQSQVKAAVTDVVAADFIVINNDYYLHQHLFSHEDSKKYPEFVSDKICSGFTEEVYVPARSI